MTQEDRALLSTPAPRILLVDDDIHFLKLVAKVLTDHGMNVITAIDADEARAQLEKVRPELIISDLMMPGTTGDAFCRELQKDPETATIPFILVSAVRDPATRLASFELGCMDYVVKPVFVDELAAKVSAIIRKNRTTRILMLTDPLTGVKNRWFFAEELPRLVLQAWRGKWALSLVIIDVNGFKKINDNYSHSFGDKVLQAVAAELKRIFRASDVIIRYGGDEFVIALPETNKPESILALNRLFDVFKNFICVTDNGEDVKIELSAGVATFPDNGKTLEEIFEISDACLYKVKKAGKNGFAIPGEKDSIFAF